MDFRDHIYVQAIAQYGNISSAAKALFISQPSLSKFLQKLERKLKTPLFERVNKKMYPTYAGEQFLMAGKEILRLQNNLDTKISRIVQHSAGRLSIATTSTRGNYILPIVLPPFKEKFPNYHIDIKERNVDELEKELSEGGVNLAIYSLPERNREFKYYHINTEEVVLCVNPKATFIKFAVQKKGFSYPWIDLRYLKEEVFFINDPTQWKIGRIGKQLLWEAHLNPEITMLRNLDTCLNLASRGLGQAFCFDICVKCFKNYEIPPVYLSTGNNKPYRSEFVVATRIHYQLEEAEEYFLKLMKTHFGV